MGVLLDVVYNHLGPDGNYLRTFADGYFTDRYECEWGEAVNFDGPDAQFSRDFFVSNACYWIEAGASRRRPLSHWPPVRSSAFRRGGSSPDRLKPELRAWEMHRK
jgi:hypothetical protein